jgi:hypothetical protein
LPLKFLDTLKCLLKYEAVTGNWRQMHKEELQDSLLLILGWSGRKDWMGGNTHTVFWWRNVNERDLLENLGVDGRLILKWI